MPVWKRSRGHPPQTWLKQITVHTDTKIGPFLGSSIRPNKEAIWSLSGPDN